MKISKHSRQNSMETLPVEFDEGLHRRETEAEKETFK